MMREILTVIKKVMDENIIDGYECELSHVSNNEIGWVKKTDPISLTEDYIEFKGENEKYFLFENNLVLVCKKTKDLIVGFG